MVRLPSKFKLINRTWKVKLVSSAQMARLWRAEEGDEPRGLCDSAKCIIYLNIEIHEHDDELIHTFWHEVVHALLFAEGTADHDEVFVDRWGAMLHQIIKTAGPELEIQL